MTDPVSTAVAAPRLALGAGVAAYEAAVERARTEDWASRLFTRDVSLWTADPRVAETISDRLGWRELALSDGRGLQSFDPALAPLSTSLGVLGMPGLTAYVGLLDIASFQEGDAVFVSGAAGAVGSVAGQIAKAKGASLVVGSAGSAGEGAAARFSATASRPMEKERAIAELTRN